MPGAKRAVAIRPASSRDPTEDRFYNATFWTANVRARSVEAVELVPNAKISFGAIRGSNATVSLFVFF